MSEDWKAYPHIVELVSALQRWKSEFQIIEYVEASPSGYDDLGRIQGASDQSTFEVADDYCWTHYMSDGDWIEPGVRTGDWGSGGVNGWFIGKVPIGEVSPGRQMILQAHAFACSVCKGSYTYEDENGEEQDCEACALEDAQYIYLLEVLEAELDTWNRSES